MVFIYRSKPADVPTKISTLNHHRTRKIREQIQCWCLANYEYCFIHNAMVIQESLELHPEYSRTNGLVNVLLRAIVIFAVQVNSVFYDTSYFFTPDERKFSGQQIGNM